MLRGVTHLAILGVEWCGLVSLYQRSGRRPILTNSVCYIAIGGAVYVYVGDTGRKGKGWAGREKKHPHRVLLSDIGYLH
jgi:hypothetical protein